MKKSIGLVFTLSAVLLAVILAGCAAADTITVTQTLPAFTVTQTLPGSTVTQTMTVTATQPPASTGVPTQTAGALAVAGGQVYSLSCDVDYCHDGWTEGAQSGTGGKVYFAQRDLSIFKTAEGFFNFLKLYKPVNFPGSLSDEKLVEVTAFMLVELDKVPASALFGLGNLESFTITK